MLNSQEIVFLIVLAENITLRTQKDKLTKHWINCLWFTSFQLGGCFFPFNVQRRSHRVHKHQDQPFILAKWLVKLHTVREATITYVLTPKAPIAADLASFVDGTVIHGLLSL